MRYHGTREEYFVVDEGLVTLPPAAAAPHAPAPAAPAQPAAATVEPPKYKFGWISQKSRHTYTDVEKATVVAKLAELGGCMNNSKDCQPAHEGKDGGDSETISAGYTYLGQYIAHEITFDKGKDSQPENFRSPEIDLDSLYGAGPESDLYLYEDDHARLKLGATSQLGNLTKEFDNDLPREQADTENPGRALIVDPRNDENLAVAQIHVAFVKFHNRIVDELEKGGCPKGELFARARAEVLRHFQLIILEDYLPKMAGREVLERVRERGLCEKFKEIKKREDLFIPLEFSAAAFRIGHSMIRNRYSWNSYRPSVHLSELFDLTSFRGTRPGMSRLPSDWVIDWTRFYDFTDFKNADGSKPYPRASKPNMASKFGTFFNLHFPPSQGEEPQRSITARNLARGFELGLPTGEEMAACLGLTPLDAEQLAEGAQRHVLADPVFQGRTPLWYYILKEAELSETGQLGPVGGLIVAGTLVEIIRHSRYSILRDPGWIPKYGRPAQGAGKPRFEMPDLLHFADVVNPIGKHQNAL